MYRRNIFAEVGGFLKGLWPNEDVEFDLRVKKKGYKLIYNPSAIVYHYRPDSLNKFLNMMFRYGKSQGYTTTIYGFFRKIQFVPVFVLVLLLLEIFLFIKKSILSLLLPGIFFVSTTGYFFLKTKNVFRSVEFLLYLILTTIVWSVGFFYGLLRWERN
jgi:GT2 family glycosyltransferase